MGCGVVGNKRRKHKNTKNRRTAKDRRRCQSAREQRPSAIKKRVWARKFKQALLLRRDLNDDRRRRRRLTYFETHSSSNRGCRSNEQSDIAWMLPNILLTPEIEVRHEKLLFQFFLFVVCHP